MFLFSLKELHKRKPGELTEAVVFSCGSEIRVPHAGTLLETNNSPLKIGNPKRKRSYSNHPFSGALAVSFREGTPPKTNMDTKNGQI